MKNILTGLRPTGNLHLGHYFGAVSNWVKLQNEYNTFIEIADVQALTDNFNNPLKVRENVSEVVLDLIACGIEPSKVTFFVQSYIKEIAELTVFYSNLVTVARLYRNPTVKTEIKQKEELFGEKGEGVTYGFIGYPVSQAADITIFDGECIPVGDDQKPLVEQCRELVKKFNSIYGETFKVPEHMLSEFPRIKGLDGNEKMGKSLGNCIYLVDDYETVKKKIRSAVTDPNKLGKNDPADPLVCMVYYYHKLVNKDYETVCSNCKKGAMGCVSCKDDLTEKMMEFLKPIQERRSSYSNSDALKILEDGTNKASLYACNKMNEIKKNMKIDYFNN